ncbi:MAG: hypothetical protein ACREF6_22095 [Alphaproteobacteria bacterium]
MSEIIPFPKCPVRVTAIMRSRDHQRFIQDVRDGHVVSVPGLPADLSAMWVRDDAIGGLAAVRFQDLPILKLGRLRLVGSPAGRSLAGVLTTARPTGG